MSRAKGHNQLIATPETLVAALVSACQEYTDDIKEQVEEGILKIGEEAVEQVKALSPVYEGTDRVSKTGKHYHTTNKNMKYPKGSYKRSWTYSVDRERGKIKVTVHAKKPHYRLTHLLENGTKYPHGHLNRDGTKRTKAIPHVSIVNNLAQKKVDKLLEEL